MDSDLKLLASLGVIDAQSDWWKKMSPEQQQEYIKTHPKTKMKPTGPSKGEEPSKEPEGTEPSVQEAPMEETVPSPDGTSISDEQMLEIANNVFSTAKTKDDVIYGGYGKLEDEVRKQIGVPRGTPGWGFGSENLDNLRRQVRETIDKVISKLPKMPPPAPEPPSLKSVQDIARKRLKMNKNDAAEFVKDLQDLAAKYDNDRETIHSEVRDWIYDDVVDPDGDPEEEADNLSSLVDDIVNGMLGEDGYDRGKEPETNGTDKFPKATRERLDELINTEWQSQLDPRPGQTARPLHTPKTNVEYAALDRIAEDLAGLTGSESGLPYGEREARRADAFAQALGDKPTRGEAGAAASLYDDALRAVEGPNSDPEKVKYYQDRLKFYKQLASGSTRKVPSGR